MPTQLVIVGTRPEAIKLAPVVLATRSVHPEWTTLVAMTGQHDQLAARPLATFGVTPDISLGAAQPGMSLTESVAATLAAIGRCIATHKPDLVIVQGDTTSTMCGALAAFYAGLGVAHVEAGLRTGDLHAPFPEEFNRVVVGRVARLHFAATEEARVNLLREGVANSDITVTGNTGIDAVLHIARQLDSGVLRSSLRLPRPNGRRLLLVTAHRRENHGGPMASIAGALKRLARRGDVEILFPVHPNPNVRATVEQLRGVDNITLTQPLEYVDFVHAMMRAHLILTDSGGVQEEAPSLGKPVLVMRDKTERPEAIAAGTSVLVGTDEENIVRSVSALLDDETAYRLAAQRTNPYGDGAASHKIVRVLAEYFTHRG